MKKSAKTKRGKNKLIKALARVQFPVNTFKRNQVMESKREKILKTLSQLEAEED